LKSLLCDGQILLLCHSVFANSAKQARSQDSKFGWGELQCLGADIFRVLLYCYSLLAVSTVSVTEYTNIVVIK